MKKRTPLLSIITPAYNEDTNLPLMYESLTKILDTLEMDWEWIVVDDHSSDNTFETIRELKTNNNRIRGFRLAHNFGSHKAMICGLEKAQGDCAIILAADLQDPPEVMPSLLESWKAGNQVVWAVRRERKGEKKSKLIFAYLYYFLMRRIAGISDLPSTGSDFFLLDRHVIDSLSMFRENNASLMNLVTWMGFRQSSVDYDKEERLHGKSGWTFHQKLKMVVDSVTSFTFLPIRLMSYFGFIVALLGLLYAGIVLFNVLGGERPHGWASLMIVVLVLGGSQMMMMGVLGEYLWRTLDESRRRPHYILESVLDEDDELQKLRKAG